MEEVAQRFGDEVVYLLEGDTIGERQITIKGDNSDSGEKTSVV